MSRSPERGTDGAAELEQLGAAIRDGGVFDAVVAAPAGGQARLRVRNRTAPVMAENIFCAAGPDGEWWFWWGWAERIAPAGDVAAAARLVMKVLAAIG
jgi:predicted pyridoxine 5'-phosphate oxidase superfamily flavin-nucleotide-binding protein